MRIRALTLIGFFCFHLPMPAETPRREWQVVQDYVTLMDADPVRCSDLGMPMGQRINSFLSYTGIATDYGFLGPGEKSLAWEPGHVCVELEDAQWGGLWHSLAGKGADRETTLDFQQAYPAFIPPAYQPKIMAVRLRGHGHGAVKLEIKDAAENILWSDRWGMDTATDQDFVRPIPMLHRAKLLNWISESGCRMCLDQIALEIEMPELPTDLRVFLKSYVKLARCYDPSSGLVKDRAHSDSGAFDSVPACGMFCLASAVAKEQGIVSDTFAKDLLRRTHRVISGVKTASGLLPHFLHRSPTGGFEIHPGTEYSSVDTAIYYHSMLIAAQILGDAETAGSLIESIRRIRMDDLLDASGHVIHGLNSDGSRIPASWQDWGGETALVLLFQHLALGDDAAAKMKTDGKAWQGTGFIPEIQSLFFPGFDTDTKDHVSGQNWAAIRDDNLKRQRAYFKQLPAPLDGTGVFGLSAGEGRRGMGYLVSGTDLADQTIIHPHYMLMSASRWNDTTTAITFMESLEKTGTLPPWGMVENIDVKTGEMLPMLGSLNAGFEALAAYHLLAKHRKQPDAIYQAVRAQPDLAAALRIFYP